MKSLIRMSFMVSIIAAFVIPAVTAHARNTEHFYSEEEAVEEGEGNAPSTSIPFYLEGQAHPPAVRVIGTWTANRPARGFLRSDEASCQVAFRPAIISLQKRAKDEGGNGIIDIVSVTRGKETSSSSDYRCVAGATVVHVALRGTVVEFVE